jgi:hypothetical protein
MACASALLWWFAPPAVVLVWEPCGMCWGQGRILVPGDDGRLVPWPCGWCAGAREVAKAVPAP